MDGKTQNNEFLSSLGEMTENDFAKDTAAAPEKKKKKRRPADYVTWAFLAVCLGVFAYCAYQIILSLGQYAAGENLYDDYSEQYADFMDADEDVEVVGLSRNDFFAPMKDYAEIARSGADVYDPTAAKDNTVTSAKFQKMLVFLTETKLNAADLCGYIDVDGTRVSYPVVQYTDNEFYLTHGVDGDYLKAGSIFLDFRNSTTLSDNLNTVIYGHNMTNGSMFHDLTKYLDSDFFYSHPIVIYTFDGIYTYQVFSIHEAEATENYFRTYFYSDTDYVTFCEEMEAKSVYHLDGIEFTSGSRILTLSTCISGNADGRYAIHALLVKTER